MPKPTGAIWITASSAAMSCPAATAFERPAIQPGEIAFDVSVGPILLEDGSSPTRIRSTSVRFSIPSGIFQLTSSVGRATEVRGEAASGSGTTASLDFDAESKGHKVVVKGKVDALGCPPPAAAPLPPPMAATVEVAGKKLSVRAARWSTKSLELLTGSESCRDLPSELPSELRVIFDWQDRDRVEVAIAGSMISPRQSGVFDKKKVRFVPEPKGPGEVEVHADVTIQGYPVKVEGKLSVTECPK